MPVYVEKLVVANVVGNAAYSMMFLVSLRDVISVPAA